MTKANNYVFLIRFQNNNQVLIISDSNKDLIDLGEYLSKNRNFILKDVKVYEKAKTRFVRTSIQNVLKPIFKYITVLDQELIRRNFY